MNNTDINDIRNSKDFRGKTFSGYKLLDVKNALINKLKKENIDGGLYWCYELLCSGHINELWETIIIFIASNISILNPKIIIYSSVKCKEFDILHKNGYINYELTLRNNMSCRKLLCELIIILALSLKKPSIEKTTLLAKEDFYLENISLKLKAPSTDYIDAIFKSNDPLELYIPLNELAFCLDKSNNDKNIMHAMYWIEWIIQYEKIAKDKNIKLIAAYRNITNINELHKKDYIWIVWDIIKQNTINEMQKRVINSLYELFIFKYKPSYRQKKKCVIYSAIEFIIDYKNIKLNELIINNKEILVNSELYIDNTIKLIKENEISPQMDYLFNNVEVKSEREKTIEKLNKLQDLL